MNAGILGTRPTGLGQATLALIREFARGRAEIAVYTGFPQAIDGLPVAVRRAPAVIRPEGGGASHLARLLWIQTALRARVRRDRLDVLLNAVPEGLLRPRVPQVTIVHDLIPLAFPREYPRQQLYFRRFVPAVLRQSRAVVANSEATRRDVLSRYGLSPVRVAAIPFGCDASRFRPDGERCRGRGEAYVLYVGNLLPHKNLARLVEAVAQAGEVRRLRLLVVGHGRAAAVKALRQQAAERGVDLDLRSYVPSAELAALYRGAAVFVLPSLMEGFGLTALEAMASGTPVIASTTSSLPEVVGSAGLLVDPTDARQIAEAILRVVTDPGLREALAARGQDRALRFAWERTALGVMAILEAAAATA